MRLILIRGLPGSGKSTYAKTFNIFHVESDMFFQRDGKYEWKASENAEAARNREKFVRLALQCNMDVVVSDVFYQISEIETYEKMAEEFGATFTVYKMNNLYRDVHNVSQHHIEIFKKRWENFPPEIVLHF